MEREIEGRASHLTLLSPPAAEPGESPARGFATVEQAIKAIASGEMVIVVDSPDRENEGDLVMAADHVTPEAINFMAVHGRGLVCVAMERARLSALGVPPMTAENSDPNNTAFHVSVDHRHLTTTGISASDRCVTIRALADPASTPSDFARPGHVFPLAAREGGVLQRAGHTEAAVDLARLAGCQHSGVICEIARPDGEMARVPDLLAMARTHGLLIIAISQLAAYRRRVEPAVTRVSAARLPLDAGEFHAIGYRGVHDHHDHVALVMGDVTSGSDVLVRLHSECLTGDVFGSRRCDCGRQLDRSLQLIAEEGCGVVVYMRGHEGRGIGLLPKLDAYALQDEGADTVDANLRLGFPSDMREYAAGAHILRDLGVSGVRLLTNNPNKCEALERHGVTVASRVPLVCEATPDSAPYLAAKQARMGHLLQESASVALGGS